MKDKLINGCNTILKVGIIFGLGFILGRLINAKALNNQQETIASLKRQLTDVYTNRYYSHNVFRFDTHNSDISNAKTKN